MKFLKYEDADELMEAILIKYRAGKKNKQIAEETGKSPANVSYYLKKLGVTRKRPRMDIPLCLVCRKNPPDPDLRYICRDSLCGDVYFTTKIVCQMPPELSDYKLLLEIQPKTPVNIPMDTAVICTMDSVTRVWRSNRDHLEYHAYRWRKKMGTKGPKPPSPLWIDEQEEKRWKDRKKEEAYAKRMQASDYQPRRLR